MSMLRLSPRLLVLLPQLLLLLLINRSVISAQAQVVTQFDVGVDGQLNVEDHNNGGFKSVPVHAPKDTTVTAAPGHDAPVDDDEDEEDPDCKDQEMECSEWASWGECEGNPAFMYPACPQSCNLCGKGDMQDLLSHALALKEMSTDLEILGWGVEQELFEGYEEEFEISELLKDEAIYMLEVVNVDEMYDSYKTECLNRDSSCALWAVKGECNKSYEYMNTHCAPSCKACHMIDWYARGCSMPENTSELDVWKPGDLNKMFERIVADYRNVNIISKPSAIEAEDGPWVLTIDNFLSDEECEHLIAWGHKLGYERSRNDDGDVNSINEGRTSSQSWCRTECHNDPKTIPILQRVEALTGISDLNSEELQLLRYEPGQRYHDHHDFIDYEFHRPQGVRILTVFMYLNDVEAGGETKFTSLGTDGIIVTPKKGTVLIWPSVLNDDPNSIDLRTHHEALASGAGIKFGANAWFHMRNFKTPLEEDCHFLY